MPSKTNLTILVNTTSSRGVSGLCIDSIERYRGPHAVYIDYGREIDWSIESIGNARYESLDYVKTEYVMFLDSDDELLTEPPEQVPSGLDGLIYYFLGEKDKPYREFRNNKMCMFATCRTILNTEFAWRSLGRLVEEKGVREDVWMMHDLLRYGEYRYVNKYLIFKSHGGSCDRNPDFIRRHYEEYASRWDKILTYEFLQEKNAERHNRVIHV